jgi:hypothetical protein
MNWDAISAIGQAVSALALVVVIVQIRYARAESQRSLSQGRGQAFRELLAGDERNSQLLAKANSALGAHFVAPPFLDQKGLTDEEMMLLNWNVVAWWNYFLQIIPNADDLPAMERVAFHKSIRVLYGRPGINRLYYESAKTFSHPDAVKYVDRVLAQAE